MRSAAWNELKVPSHYRLGQALSAFWVGGGEPGTL